MDAFLLDGQSYNVGVKSVNESFTVMYTENTGRTSARGAPMQLDAIGTFFSHEVTIFPRQGFETDFDSIYHKLSRPSNIPILVSIVHEQKMLNYDAYVSSGSRPVRKKTHDKTYWGEFTFTLTPITAQVIADGGNYDTDNNDW